ncbi:MAG: pyridoxamine 5'-phosphate oxidase family protein [Peptococcaceae bacterium]|jgi:uncharacterized protein YhbP (UPF0306 family)|nr:pyridoxamine 5'-phosphate oxidase family protein [Peptococcaceae bacterium]
MAVELKDEALSYLDSHHVATLASSGEEGPWASAVFYINDRFTLSFLSDPATRHGRNLTANPRVAVAIHEDEGDWREVRGIQLLGEAMPVSNLEKTRLIPAFIARFPSVGLIVSDPGFVRVLAQSLLYRIQPREIWYLDKKKGISDRRMVPV